MSRYRYTLGIVNQLLVTNELLGNHMSAFYRLTLHPDVHIF